mgnify:CR=1 FL=1
MLFRSIDIDLEKIRERVRGLSPDEVHEVALELTLTEAQKSRRRRAQELVTRALGGR